jgi:hypothetical protein
MSDLVAMQYNTAIAAAQQILWVCTQANKRGRGKSLNPFSFARLYGGGGVTRLP